MKFKSLQFEKAISAALFVLLLVVVGSKNALAQTQVATLQHNDTITGVFYGQNAFVSAHNAAVDGDIITLSSGSFNSCNIAKAITIHGAGCVYDSVTCVTPTIISGSFETNNNNISFEGIRLNGTVTSGGYMNISFIKCIINSIAPRSYCFDSNVNWQFINCIITSFVSNKYVSYFGGTSLYCFKGMSIINSVVLFNGYDHDDIYNPTTINNSVILFNNGLAITNIVAYNSIISVISNHNVSNCTFFNCVGIETGETSLFDGQIANNVMTVDDYSDVFENFAGIVFYDNWYQLKEEIATGFLGQDGTEVGIYGGMMPYNPRPSYMRMKRCNVAPRSTIDNKLSVEIEVLTDDE